MAQRTSPEHEGRRIDLLHDAVEDIVAARARILGAGSFAGVADAERLHSDRRVVVIDDALWLVDQAVPSAGAAGAAKGASAARAHTSATAHTSAAAGRSSTVHAARCAASRSTPSASSVGDGTAAHGRVFRRTTAGGKHYGGGDEHHMRHC